MEDRLADLKGTSTAPSIADTEALLPDYNKKINYVQFCLNKIKENNKNVVQLKERHIKATLSDQEKNISTDLNSLIEQNTKLCQSVKHDLEDLEKAVSEAKTKEPDEPETRIKDITLRAVKAKFGEVLKESQTSQIDYKSAVKEKLGRQVKIIDPLLTADQVEEICNDPQGAENLMATKLIGSAHMKLKNAVRDIQDKHKDILKLERSVQTIHQMFMDMALLVNTNGEMLDNIELNIQDAADYMKKAVIQLDKAKKSHQRSRKCMCWLLLILLVIVAIIIIIVVLAKK